MGRLKTKNVAPLLALGLCKILDASPVFANDYVIYVAPRTSPAFIAAQSKANETSVFAESSLQKALDKVAPLLNASGSHKADILMAGGEYSGKVGAGTWIVPQVKNAQARLRIAGGFAPDFATRQPFKNLTKLTTNMGRNQGILQLSKQSQLQELVISGLIFDGAESNDYDKKTNSILKGSSRTVPLLSLAMLITDRFVCADNVFINGAHGAFDPYIMPVSANTTVDITNNFFINTIKTLQIGAGIGYKGNTVKEVNLRHNTFLLNWPYNPDKTSSNVSAVTLYHNHGARQLNIEDNIFAFNPGGAMQHDWTENRMPGILLRHNLFFKNATLFDNKAAGAGVFVGKFGANAKYLIVDSAGIEEDFSYKVENNEAFDPGIPVKMLLEVKQQSSSDDVDISGYAPKMSFDAKALPLPTNAKAKAFGVQVNQLWSP